MVMTRKCKRDKISPKFQSHDPINIDSSREQSVAFILSTPWVLDNVSRFPVRPGDGVKGYNPHEVFFPMRRLGCMRSPEMRV